MVYEARKQSMTWMEMDYSKHAHFRWKTKWRLEHLGALGIMGETAPLIHTDIWRNKSNWSFSPLSVFKCLLFRFCLSCSSGTWLCYSKVYLLFILMGFTRSVDEKYRKIPQIHPPRGLSPPPYVHSPLSSTPCVRPPCIVPTPTPVDNTPVYSPLERPCTVDSPRGTIHGILRCFIQKKWPLIYEVHTF